MAFILPPLPKKPFFSRDEILRFANIADNAGQIFLGSLVLTPFVTDVDVQRTTMVLFGILVTTGCWIISLLLTRKANKLL